MDTQLQLTTTESALRDKCLAVIRAHRDGFIAAGEALATMRDSRLYRETHATFEDFCRAELGMGKSQAYRLIEAAQIMSPIGDAAKAITTESQARELSRVEPEQRQAVVERAQAATGGKITAAAIREAAKPEVEPQVIEMTPAPVPKISTATMTEAENLWVVARCSLDNIRKKDPARVTVLRKVIAYAQARIDQDK
jgi:hypothetical protein